MEKPRIYQVCALYSLVMVLLIYVGARVQRSELYSGLLITEILVALPGLALLALYRYNIPWVLRLNRVNMAAILSVIFLMPFAMLAAGLVNYGFLILIKAVFGKVQLAQVPVATDMKSLVVSLVIIGVSAGICEELLFRGVIMRGFEGLGPAAAILISAILFGFMHLDFQKMVSTTLLGALIGYLVYRSNSIYTGMLAHFTNNSMGVLLAFLGQELKKLQKPEDLGPLQSEGKFVDIPSNPFEAVPLEVRGAVFIGMGIFIALLIGGLVAMLMLFHHFTRGTVRDHEGIRQNGPGLAGNDSDMVSNRLFPGILWLLPGLLLVGIMYAALAAGLMGKEFYLLEAVLRILMLK